MYHFNQPTTKVVKAIKNQARRAQQECLTTLHRTTTNYALYVANVAYPIGTLTVTSGINDYGDSWITVQAELDTDKGRNNTIGIVDLTNEGIALAIGFTCGAAMFRSVQYHNS